MESGKTINEIRNNDNLRNTFIEKYKNFILSAASTVIGHYVSIEDDEYSIALIAFNDAIDKYDEEKGEFYNFATLLIRNRLIDEYRKHDNKIIPFSNLCADTEEFSEADLGIVCTEGVISDAVIELHTLKEELSKRSISLFDIPKCSPKAGKTKSMMYDILIFISGNKKIYTELLKKNELPSKLLYEQFGINKKFLERHRKYIITATIILTGDYPIISEYIKNLKEVKK